MRQVCLQVCLKTHPRSQRSLGDLDGAWAQVSTNGRGLTLGDLAKLIAAPRGVKVIHTEAVACMCPPSKHEEEPCGCGPAQTAKIVYVEIS